MTFERLEEIARESALQCKHVGCRIHVSAELSGRLKQRYKPDLGNAELTRLRDVVFGTPLLYQLMGVPIINDIGMVDDPTLWILVNRDGEEIERGNVDACCPHGYEVGEPCGICGTGVPNANTSESPTDKSSGAATE